MPDEFTPEEQKILGESPADSPVILDDEDDDTAAEAQAEGSPS